MQTMASRHRDAVRREIGAAAAKRHLKRGQWSEVRKEEEERKRSRTNDTGTRCAEVHLDAKRAEAYGRTDIPTG